VIVGLVPDDTTSVLDIGCRDRGLAEHLPSGLRYVGVDLAPPADVIASAEERLPFEDDEFDCAVLADVLEHLEHPHDALEEAMRVARSSVVVLLPNLYSALHRARFAAGATFGKYEFGPERRADRHRWLMNFDQARAFTHGVAEDAGWHVAADYGYEHFNRWTARAVYRLARAVGGPNLWTWEYVARLAPGR
jgi:hypothetical protein